MRITSEVLTKVSQDILDRQLFVEYMEKLKSVDLSRLGPDVKSADVITANALAQEDLQKIADVFKQKLSRDIHLNPKVNKGVIGGIILQFESLLLDGSLQNSFKESSTALKQQIEKQYTV